MANIKKAEFWVRSGTVHVGFVVDKMILGQVFPQALKFCSSVPIHQCSIHTLILKIFSSERRNGTQEIYRLDGTQ